MTTPMLSVIATLSVFAFAGIAASYMLWRECTLSWRERKQAKLGLLAMEESLARKRGLL